MNRIGTTLIAFALLAMVTATAFAVPTAILSTKSVSPREALADGGDIYDQPYNGLPNVGVGDWVYLAGTSTDTLNVTAWEWTLTNPDGSHSALNANNTAVVKFQPDVVGTFRVSLRVTTDNGQSAAVSLAVNSANYVGVGGIVGGLRAGQCKMCHNNGAEDKYAMWSATKHATAFTRKYNGAAGAAFGPACLACHTVGYNTDQAAANNGFDDRARAENWTFVDSAHGGLVAGAYDTMKVRAPLSASLTNIQCEVCHGPGSAHASDVEDNHIASAWTVGVCAKCHDSGEYSIPAQWRSSGHSHQPMEERVGCANCHSGIGFVDKLEGANDTAVTKTYMPIGCATCHDPHDATNANQLRTTSAYTLVNRVQVDFGKGNLCVNCHHSRSNADSAIVASVTSRFGPHHSNQGDMLAGTNAFTFGGEPVNNYHAAAVANACVRCHMADSPADQKTGEHTFSMKSEEGVEHVEACMPCHDLQSFDSKMADSDWDGDGATESVKAEIAGLMHNLTLALPHTNDSTITLSNNLSPIQRKAAWNWVFVKEDKSGGMHNAEYARQILTAALAQNLGVEKLNDAIPASFSLSSPYPNPFNPMTTFSYTLAKDVDVSIKVFDMAGREISTLVSAKQKAGEYKAPINMMNKASGIYLLKMEAGSFTASQKLALIK